jgi:hypothetical protein
MSYKYSDECWKWLRLREQYQQELNLLNEEFEISPNDVVLNRVFAVTDEIGKLNRLILDNHCRDQIDEE